MISMLFRRKTPGPGPVVLAALGYAFAAQIVHTVSALLTVQFYMNPAYYMVWSRIMMPGYGPPGTDFLLVSLLFSFITGLLLSGAYLFVRDSFKGCKSPWKRGMAYGLLLFVVAGIPMSLTIFLLINIPLLLIAVWAAEGLLSYLAGGAIIGRVLK